MPAQHITAETLAQLHPGTKWCQCSAEAEQAPPEQLWAIWYGQRFYCPKCAEIEGIGPK